MAALGVGLAYAGYCGILWGVMLVTGKNVGIKQLFGSTWPPVVPGVQSPGAAQSTGTAQVPGTTTAAGRGG